MANLSCINFVLLIFFTVFALNNNLVSGNPKPHLHKFEHADLFEKLPKDPKGKGPKVAEENVPEDLGGKESEGSDDTKDEVPRDAEENKLEDLGESEPKESEGSDAGPRDDEESVSEELYEKESEASAANYTKDEGLRDFEVSDPNDSKVEGSEVNDAKGNCLSYSEGNGYSKGQDLSYSGGYGYRRKGTYRF